MIIMEKLSTNGEMLSQIELEKQNHSAFDMSFHNFLSGKLGQLLPSRIKEVYPGDRIKGSPHIVTNFEPLAQPAMGNMIQKEETFFVPYSVIWDKAHRFFTGKKGFNDSMPSKTLQDIYTALHRNADGEIERSWLIIGLSDRIDNAFLGVITQNNVKVGVFLPVYFNSVFNAWSNDITNFGVSNKVLDLVSPVIRSAQRKYDALIKYYRTLTPARPDVYVLDEQLVNLLSNVVGTIWNFWFGPSSMMDYAGLYQGDYVKIFRENLTNNLLNAADVFDPVLLDESRYFSALPINWMPLRALYWCWYWNYRDQIIEADAFDPEEEMFSSDISETEIRLCLLVRQRCWFKDSFTTALTNTGDGNVVVPTDVTAIDGDTINIKGKDENLSNTSDSSGARTSGNLVTEIVVGGITYSVPSRYLSQQPDDETFENSSHYGLSLSLLDRCRRLQAWIQKRLVLGTEYDDVVYSSFMVKLSNVRMHVPELLSAGRTQVSINVVVNNTTTNDQIAGDKSAIAYADNLHDLDEVNYFAEEHGLCVSFMTIMPNGIYPEGVQRMYLRQKRFDYYWPEFATLGLDAVYNIELAGFGNVGLPDVIDPVRLGVFGYQGRYYDLKQNQDECHGRFHTDLQYLLFSRLFNYSQLFQTRPDSTAPKLNYIFVHCWPAIQPFVVEEDDDVFRSDIHFRDGWVRNMPVPSEILRG